MTEDMKLAILSKADKTEVESLTQIKANKCDIELTFKWIELMHDQLKQTIVLIIEILRSQVETEQVRSALVPNEGLNHANNSKAFLFQQSLLIGQWINRFDIRKIDQYFEDAANKPPVDVLAFQRYAENCLGEIENIRVQHTN